MRGVEQLLKQINLENEDYEWIEEEELSDLEMADLQKTVLGRIKEEEKNRNRSKKRMKRWMVSLVASLAIGSSVIAANINISQVFKDFFKEESSNIGESGKVIGKSNSNKGIKLIVEGIVADDSALNIVFGLEQEAGTKFKGNACKFGDIKLLIDGKEVWRTVKPIGTASDTRKVMGLETGPMAQQVDSMIGKQAVLQIEDIEEVQRCEWQSKLNLGEYLEQHPECSKQQVIPMEEEYLEYLDTKEDLIDSGMSVQQATEKISNLPKNILPQKDLGLSLYEDKNCIIDNIGFIDGQLHLRLSSTQRELVFPELVDEQGNKANILFEITEGGRGKDTYYVVYDVKNIESLKKMTVVAEFDKVLDTIKGQWKVPFEVEVKSYQKAIETNQTIPRQNKTDLKLVELNLSNLGINITYEGEDIEEIPNVVVILKDGEENNTKISASFDTKRAYARYDFETPISIDEVKSIKINNIEIPV